MISDNFYNILGIDYSASDEQIRRAYHQKARQFHPDLNNGNTENFAVYKDAYENLIDPLRRAEYDRQIGIRQNFGNSSLQEEFEDLRTSGNAFYPLNSRGKSGFASRLVNLLKKAFSRPKYQVEKSISRNGNGEVSDQRIDSSASPVSSVAIYSEQSLPLADDDALCIRRPDNDAEIEACRMLIQKSLSKYPLVASAMLIEATLESLPAERVFIILLQKHAANSWGIEELKYIELQQDGVCYSDQVPGLLICFANASPFRDTVLQIGIELYRDPHSPDTSFGSIN